MSQVHPIDSVSNLSAEKAEELAELRSAAKAYYDRVAQLAPSRERSLALTKIEEASMWVSKSITHN